MGDTYSRNCKKRKRDFHGQKKFLKHELVEVKSLEDGFQGSWHPGKVMICKKGHRFVKYDNLLYDDNNSDFFTENVRVSSAIDGIFDGSETPVRGRIRPVPPAWKSSKEHVFYGLCVDCYISDAWWEGVVFDHEDGSDCRQVFFPDLGDLDKVEIQNMRITQDWNEVTGQWDVRGNWLFLEKLDEYEQNNVVPVSARQIWYDMRVRQEFSKLGEWCFPENRPMWKKLIVKVIEDYLRLTVEELLAHPDFLESKMDNCDVSSVFNSTLVAEPISACAPTVVSLAGDDNQNDMLMTQNEASVIEVDKQDELSGSTILTAAMLSDDQPMPPQQQSLSIVCSESDKLLLKIKLGRKSKTPRTSRQQTSKFKWVTLSGKTELKPEFHPESVDEYYHSTKPDYSLTARFRCYLLYLGWTLETRTIGAQLRYRYTSPKGKRFPTPREAAKFLKSEQDGSAVKTEDIPIPIVPSPSHLKSRGETSSQTADDTQKSIVLSPCNLKSAGRTDILERSIIPSRRFKNRKREAGKFCIQSVTPEYCPDAIVEYLRPPDRGSHCKWRNCLRKHLAALGWLMWTVEKPGKVGRDEWRYTPPSKWKIYYSLTTACQAIVAGIESNVGCNEVQKDVGNDQEPCLKSCHVVRKHKVVASRKNKIMRRGKLRYSLSRSKNQGGDGDVDLGTKNGVVNERSSIRLTSSFILMKRKALGKVRESLDGKPRVLRSRKRVREAGPPSTSHVPRTVLSWLIDKHLVVPRSRVIYQKEKDSQPLAEGRIASDGIRCSCCQKLFTLSGFQAHVAGNNFFRPTENIYLADGKSLVGCIYEKMLQKSKSFSGEPIEKVKRIRTENWNDHICSICHYGGELILCDKCPSSFHASCLDLQNIPEGDWFCPSCCCGICGKSDSCMDTEHVKDRSLLCCHQCERQYHAKCIQDKKGAFDGCPDEGWFCCITCEKVHWGLQQLLNKPILVGQDNLTWTLVKPTPYLPEDHEHCDVVAMTENFSKLNVALDVMHECFEPVKERRTRRDLVEDVLFCRRSSLNRLNFKGFYTVLLERNEELITVATLRVYGDRVAEIPLIGTRFQHRRLGMCRILMNEVEKVMINLGIKKLVLPAAASVLSTWTTSFGFSPVTESDRSEFLGYTFLDFQGTVMCQKLLRKLPSAGKHLSRNINGNHHQPRRSIEGSSNIVDHEGNSGISEVFQEEQREGSDIVDQGADINPGDNCNNRGSNPDAPVSMLTDSSNQENEPCKPQEFTDHKKVERDKSDGNLKFYKRKKAAQLKPPVAQASYSEVEVSCR